MTKKTILLTGATSFLGRRLLPILRREGYDVMATSHHGNELLGIRALDLTNRAVQQQL